MDAATVVGIASLGISLGASVFAFGQARSAEHAASAAKDSVATGNEDAKLSAIFNHQQMLIDRYAPLVESKDFSETFLLALRAPSQLSEARLTQVFYHLIVVFSHYETLYLAYNENVDVTKAVLGGNWGEWSTAFREYLSTRVFQMFWIADADSYSTRYIHEIDKLVGGRGAISPSPESTALQRFIHYCK